MPEPYVAIRSYKRAGQVTTVDAYPDATIWVPESQGDEYREFYGDRVVTIPDSEDGNAARKCNAILNRTPSEWTVIMDDDITDLGYWERGKHTAARPAQVHRMIVEMFLLAEQLQVELWGLNYIADAMNYKGYLPFNLLAIVAGQFHGHIRPTLRYDEQTLSKDDLDFWLQNIRKFHRTLRNNKWHYKSDHGTKKGGSVSLRSKDYELDSIAYMKRKWGEQVFRVGGRVGSAEARKQNILYSTIYVPIKGV